MHEIKIMAHQLRELDFTPAPQVLPFYMANPCLRREATLNFLFRSELGGIGEQLRELRAVEIISAV